MDRRQVEIVLAVAENLSFSEAAWKTSYSASTISKQVLAAEEELGVKLFERNARSKVSLTPEGEVILPCLHRIEDGYKSLDDCILSLKDDHACRLSLACPNGFSTLGEDEMIAAFCAKNPEMSVDQIFGNVSVCQCMVQQGHIDASFCLLMPQELIPENPAENSTSILPIRENHLLFALRKDHPAIHNGKAHLAELQDEVFFFRNVNENAASMDQNPRVQFFKSACESVGFSPKLQFVSNLRTSTVFYMIAEGGGVAPLMYTPNITYPGVAYLPADRDYYTFYTVLYYLRSNRSPALKKFVKFIKTQAEPGILSKTER